MSAKQALGTGWLHYNDVIMSVFGASYHQPHGCSLKCAFGRRSTKTQKLRVTGLVREIHRWPVNSRHKGPVTRKMFPFDDVIMGSVESSMLQWHSYLCTYRFLFHRSASNVILSLHVAKWISGVSEVVDRYPLVLFISEHELWDELVVLEYSTKMTSQCRFPACV